MNLKEMTTDKLAILYYATEIELIAFDEVGDKSGAPEFCEETGERLPTEFELRRDLKAIKAEYQRRR